MINWDKLNRFFKWMENSGGEGNDPIYIIPTISLFELYRMEHSEEESLNDEEQKYIKLKQENLVFQKGIKGTLKGDLSKFCLADNFGWSEKAKPQENGTVDYVSWNFDGLITENVEDVVNGEENTDKTSES